MTNSSEPNTTIPAVNIKETPDTFEVQVAAPGLKKEDFNVQLIGNLLTISCETAESREDAPAEKYFSRELSYQSFKRIFTLQKDAVNADKTEVKYENGVFTPVNS